MMTPENLENLTRNATFAADGAAINEIALGATNAQITRRVVRRTIEFLIGNGLVEFKSDGSEMWLAIDPPYPHWPAGADSEEPLAP